MEKEKMIDKILSYMCPYFSDGICGRDNIVCDNDNLCVKRSFAKGAAEELLPDGAVVLTREEYERLKNNDQYKSVYGRIVSANIKEFTEELAKARKETAREILKTLWDWKDRETTLQCDLYELAEKYGLEVDE